MGVVVLVLVLVLLGDVLPAAPPAPAVLSLVSPLAVCASAEDTSASSKRPVVVVVCIVMDDEQRSMDGPQLKENEVRRVSRSIHPSSPSSEAPPRLGSLSVSLWCDG